MCVRRLRASAEAVQFVCSDFKLLAAAGAVAEEAGVEIVAPVRERHQPQPLQLVLLDFGLAEELTPPVRFHFISFLHYIAKGG